MDKPDLYALRGSKVLRPILDEEREQVRAYSQKGKGANGRVGILFIHGFTVTPANFYSYARTLHNEGFSVHLPVLPGHAAKYEDLDKVTREDWKNTVREGYDLLMKKWKCKKIVVSGISLGGALALWLASSEKRIDRLILLAPAVFPIPLLSVAKVTILPLFSALGIRYWMHIAGDVKREDGFELGYRRVSIHGMKELTAVMDEVEAVLPEVKAPTILFQGKVDHEVPAARAQEIIDRISSDQKELIWLENSYHEIPRERDSAMVLDRIQRELDTLAGGL